MDCNKIDQLSVNSFCSYNHLRGNQQIQWTGSVEQKIWGLMIVWSEAKFNFPFFDRITDVNWDNKVQEYIPRVINTGTIDEYYQVLMEFAAILKDGHTAVIPPWITFPRIMKSEYDYPPVELSVIEDKFFVARISNTEELLKQRIYPGLEVLEIGEQTPIRDYLKENFLRFKSYGTSQADETVGLIAILSGTKDSQVLLKVRDPDGTIRLVSLTRNSTDEEGTIFQWRLAQGFMSDSFIESKLFPPGICYIQILSFLNKKVVEEFQKIIDDLDLPSIRGIILDVRHNLGGNDAYIHNIISFLTDEPLKASKWKSICYVPAYRSWGHPTRWEEHAPYIIEPRSGRRYNGPLIVLAGPGTFSGAEDFLVPLKYSKRAVVVGEKTAGSTGNALSVPLPGGGTFRVVSKRDMFPDGQEFVGIGISPDISIRPTKEDLLQGKDVILQKGIDVILNWRSDHKKEVNPASS